MKLIFTLFVICSALSSCLAQIDRGTISYQFTAGTDKKPEMNKGEIVFVFEPGFSRTETTFDAMGTTIKIVRDQPFKSLMLFNIKDKYFAVQSVVKENEIVNTDIAVLDEFKTICGYNCKKAIVTRDNKTFTIWFTDQISAMVLGQEVFQGFLNGFPLEIMSNANGIFTAFTATEVSLIVPANSFSLSVPNGYELIEKDQIGEKLIEASGK